MLHDIRTPVTVLALLLSACATSEGPSGLSLLDTEAYVDREVLLSIDDGDDGVARMLVAEDFDLDELEGIDGIGVGRLQINGDREVKAVVQALEDDHRVRFAEPNYIARTASITSDPYVDYQWNLDQMHVAEAWPTTTGEGVVVAVLDTGVKRGGPDGIAHLLSGYDFYNRDSDPTDGDGHGTFVAGTIGQTTNNGVGLAGVAYGASILPVKVMSDQGYGDISAIANGITWATDQGADVISMSLGSSYPSKTLEDACAYAYDRNVVVVAASGNEFASKLGYPAAYDTVFSVGATRLDRTRAAYSNYGSGLDFMAPGGDMSRDDNGDGYADGVLQETIENGSWTYTFWEGTSMATPHVAAAVALVRSVGDYSPDEVYQILADTAIDTGASGYDTTTGYGVVNVGAAVAKALGGGGADPGDGGDPGTGEDPGAGGDSGDGGSTGTVDTTAPEISGVGGYTQGSQFTVYWTTNEPADSYVNFDGYGAYGDATLTTSHTLTFTGQAGSRYSFSFESTDAAGNLGTAGPYSIQL